MPIDRRSFLATAGLGLLTATTSCDDGGERAEPADSIPDTGEWADVRRQFTGLSTEYVHLSPLFIASHPEPVRRAIERHRRALDESPTIYLQDEVDRQEKRVLGAASGYLGVATREIALTDSTTMGIGMIYNGLRLRPGQEILTTEQDYYVTHESARLAAERSGASVRKVSLYRDVSAVTEEEIAGTIAAAVSPATRVLALTWVHSSTGLKIPLRRIADVVAEANAGRDEADHVLFCVDGVHGFGVEDVTMSDLGCDFFAAGCHKWLFGPRGTGILWGDAKAWASVTAIIPSFRDDGRRDAWVNDETPEGPTNGSVMTPGGFKAYEHQWALAEAFAFHEGVGKGRVAARTHELARQAKEGLAAMSHVTLYTPLSDSLSSGLVCFDVAGMSPGAVVSRLRDRKIVATTTPYARSHARIGTSVRNDPGEVDAFLREVRALA